MANENTQDEPSEVDASGSSHCSDAEWDDYEYTDFAEDSCCHYCCGEGFGIVGTDWDSDDGVNGPYPGDIEQCPCCGGTGKAEDCTFW
jgi:hypothetical protein